MSDRSLSIAQEALRRHPRSRADALGIDMTKNTPSPLFQWLIASLLFSARISADQAEAAARALFDQGWRTADAMAASTWEQRTKVLNAAGYARYDESTSRYIGDATERLLDLYDGDLRAMRQEVDGDLEAMRASLKKFKGIGDVGADIFLREAQLSWDHLHPFADQRALTAAAKLGLPRTARDLAALVPPRDFPRLLDALVRIDLADEVEDVKRAA